MYVYFHRCIWIDDLNLASLKKQGHSDILDQFLRFKTKWEKHEFYENFSVVVQVWRPYCRRDYLFGDSRKCFKIHVTTLANTNSKVMSFCFTKLVLNDAGKQREKRDVETVWNKVIRQKRTTSVYKKTFIYVRGVRMNCLAIKVNVSLVLFFSRYSVCNSSIRMNVRSTLQENSYAGLLFYFVPILSKTYPKTSSPVSLTETFLNEYFFIHTCNTYAFVNVHGVNFFCSLDVCIIYVCIIIYVYTHVFRLILAYWNFWFDRFFFQGIAE